MFGKPAHKRVMCGASSATVRILGERLQASARMAPSEYHYFVGEGGNGGTPEMARGRHAARCALQAGTRTREG